MNYTKDTTLEEYQAWLDTNPPLSEIHRISRIVFHIINDTCVAISKLCRRVGRGSRTRSCLSISHTTPGLGYDASVIGTSREAVSRIFWRSCISYQLELTRLHIIALDKRESLREEMWAMDMDLARRRQTEEWIKDEIAMDELLSQAIEVLTGSPNY